MLSLDELLTLAEQMVKGVNVNGGVNVSSPVNVNRGDNVNTRRRRNVNRVPWKQKVCLSPLSRVYGSLEETLEMGMTETQREVFLMVDEWWRKFGFGPSVREIALWRGKAISPTQKVVDRLVKIGALKRVRGMARSLRPTYINFRNLE